MGESQMIPSTLGAMVGCLLAHIAALPRHRQIDSLWKRWVVVSDGDEPTRLSMRRQMRLISSHARTLQPPSVSAIRGIKSTPTARQSSGVQPLSYPRQLGGHVPERGQSQKELGVGGWK